MSTLDYLKRMANVLSKDGDGWGDKHECTIPAEKEDSDVRTYRLVIESTDDEFGAILSAGAAYGCFVPQIYKIELKNEFYRIVNEQLDSFTEEIVRIQLSSFPEILKHLND